MAFERGTVNYHNDKIYVCWKNSQLVIRCIWYYQNNQTNYI